LDGYAHANPDADAVTVYEHADRNRDAYDYTDLSFFRLRTMWISKDVESPASRRGLRLGKECRLFRRSQLQ
jgi:hypothetical protein